MPRAFKSSGEEMCNDLWEFYITFQMNLPIEDTNLDFFPEAIVLMIRMGPNL